MLCASTREGEEHLILDAWAKVSVTDSGNPFSRTGGTALLLIVPRHPQRFDDVASLILAKGLRLQRRSDDCDIAETTDVVLGDSMGEMFAYYASVDLAFIGGSLLDYGCQNLIEPCAVGTPVIIGPSTYNFAEAATAALSHGAAEQIGSADALVKRALELLVDPQQRANLVAAGSEFIKQHQGATTRTMALIDAAYKPLPS
jgi:3-deoxy-D-manno-octulosonic-acid transferase